MGCRRLRSLTFEEGSQLINIKESAFTDTPLEKKNGPFLDPEEMDIDEQIRRIEEWLQFEEEEDFEEFE